VQYLELVDTPLYLCFEDIKDMQQLKCAHQETDLYLYSLSKTKALGYGFSQFSGAGPQHNVVTFTNQQAWRQFFYVFSPALV
jgi:hypothetical protein